MAARRLGEEDAATAASEYGVTVIDEQLLRELCRRKGKALPCYHDLHAIDRKACDRGQVRDHHAVLYDPVKDCFDDHEMAFKNCAKF